MCVVAKSGDGLHLAGYVVRACSVPADRPKLEIKYRDEREDGIEARRGQKARRGRRAIGETSHERRGSIGMSGARMWEALAEVTGRAVRFPNIPLRLVAPSPEAAAKGLSVVTFITVPSTSKVRP